GDNIISVLPDVIGATIGTAIGEKLAPPPPDPFAGIKVVASTDTNRRSDGLIEFDPGLQFNTDSTLGDAVADEMGSLDLSHGLTSTKSLPHLAAFTGNFVGGLSDYSIYSFNGMLTANSTDDPDHLETVIVTAERRDSLMMGSRDESDGGFI